VAVRKRGMIEICWPGYEAIREFLIGKTESTLATFV
jgi:hypothetical protein